MARNRHDSKDSEARLTEQARVIRRLQERLQAKGSEAAAHAHMLTNLQVLLHLWTINATVTPGCDACL